MKRTHIIILIDSYLYYSTVFPRLSRTVLKKFI